MLIEVKQQAVTQVALEESEVAAEDVEDQYMATETLEVIKLLE